MPPTAGPTTRVELTMALLRAMALTRSGLPTSSTIRVWRAGISKVVDSPHRKAKTIR